MKILLIAKLLDHTLSENVIMPILASNVVEHIFILRDRVGNNHNELVSYHTPKKKNLVRHIDKVNIGVALCKKEKIDAIIGVLNIPHGYIGKMVSKLTNIPYIHMTIAGHREFWIKGKLMEKFNLQILKNSHITVTGEQTRNYLLTKGYDDKKISIMSNLPNGKFNIVDVNNDDNKIYDIISLSRIDKNKNLPLLIRAVEKLNNPQLKVLVAGDGPEFENIKSMVQEKQLESNFEFLGFVSDIDYKIDILKKSKIFISCSKGEGFPVSLLEAMSCGCVPVVSNVGDCADIIKNDYNGYIYEDTDNEDELVQSLSKIIYNCVNVDILKFNALKVKKKISVKSNGEIWNKILTTLK